MPQNLGSVTCQVCGGYNWLEETRTPGFIPQNKKITDDEWELSPTGLCKTTLCSEEGGSKRCRLDRGLCHSSGNIAGDLCPIQWAGDFESSQEEKSWKPRNSCQFQREKENWNYQGWKRCHYLNIVWMLIYKISANGLVQKNFLLT